MATKVPVKKKKEAKPKASSKTKEIVFKYPSFLFDKDRDTGISNAHIYYEADFGKPPEKESDLHDYIFKKHFVPIIKESKSEINLYFFNEIFEDNYSYFSERVIDKELADRDIDSSKASYLPIITGFFAPEKKLWALTGSEFDNLKKISAPFILRTLDAISTPSVFVLPSMNLEVRKRCYAHTLGYGGSSSTHTLYKYKQHTVIFSNSQIAYKSGKINKPCVWKDSPQNALEFDYTASLIANVLGVGSLELNTIANRVFSDCSMHIIDNNIDAINSAFDFIERDREHFFSIDTETNGLNPFVKTKDLLTIQIASNVYTGFLFKFSDVYGATAETRKVIVERLNSLYKKKTAIYFNMSFEAKWLSEYGICIGDTFHDAQLLWKTLDLNVSASLSLATKRHAPELAGYSDVFDTSVDKSKMSNLAIEELAPYAIGDAIATYRVMYNLLAGVEHQGALYQTYKIKLQYAYYMSQFLEQVPHPINRKFASLNVARLNRLKLILKKKRLELVPYLIKAKYLLKPKAGKEAMVIGKNEFGGNSLGVPAKGNLFEFDVLYSQEGLDLGHKLPKGVEQNLSKGDALFYLRDEPYVKVTNALNLVEKIITTYLGDEKTGSSDKGLFGKSIGDDLYANFSITSTKTGRVACNPNLQNIPNKTAVSKCVNASLQAPSLLKNGEYEEYTYLFLDYSQVELRVAAVLSGDENMKEVYRSGGDIHTNTASILCNMTLEEFKKQDSSFIKLYRQRAKAVNFGLVYGMQAKTLVLYAEKSYGVILTLEEAQTYSDNFFNAYPKLREWHERVRYEGNKFGYVFDIAGFPHQYEDARHNVGNNWNSYRESAIRNLINSPVQGFAAHLCLWAGSEVMRGFSKLGVADVYNDNTIHDALYYRVPKSKHLEYASYIKWQMENLEIEKYYGVKFDIPLLAEVEVGTDYARHNVVEIESVKPQWASVA
jgi:DNA polymerase I-like protein with 3'-5' exonuclease and polymerase domains